MDGYLVVIRCMMDDFPVRLFESRWLAQEFADSIDIDKALSLIPLTVDPRNVFGAEVVEFHSGDPNGVVHRKQI